MRVAYIVGSYPFINITFIYREISAMRRQGVQVEVIGTIRPKEGFVLEEARHEMETTFYLQPVNWSRFVLAHLHFLMTRPHVYLSSLLFLMTRPHGSLLLCLKTLWHFALGAYVAWYLRGERRPDHIHAHFAHRNTVIAYVAARLLDLEHSFTAHARDIYAEGAFLHDKIRAAAFVTTCTRYNWEYLTSLSDDPAKVHCLYHGLDFSDFAGLPDSPKPKPPLILAIGQLREKKGFPYLIEACAVIRDQGQDFRCRIIGEGPNRADLEAQIRRLQLQEYVTLKGNIPFSQVLDTFAQATVFTLPCVVAADGDRDGIPNVILEAMASGVPVVSTSISAIPEVVIDNETGYLVPSRDSKELANRLVRLLNSPQDRARLARNAKAFVHKRFSLDHNVQELKLLFEEYITLTAPAEKIAKDRT